MNNKKQNTRKNNKKQISILQLLIAIGIILIILTIIIPKAKANQTTIYNYTTQANLTPVTKEIITIQKLIRNTTINTTQFTQQLNKTIQAHLTNPAIEQLEQCSTQKNTLKEKLSLTEQNLTMQEQKYQQHKNYTTEQLKECQLNKNLFGWLALTLILLTGGATALYTIRNALIERNGGTLE